MILLQSLLLNLQKEADEVLDLMINVPNMIDEPLVVVKESNFVQMVRSTLSRHDLRPSSDVYALSEIDQQQLFA